MIRPVKKRKTKRNATALPAGVKVIPAPKSASLRTLLTGPDIITSGGARTTHRRTIAR